VGRRALSVAIALLVLLGAGYLAALYYSAASITLRVERVVPRVSSPLQVVTSGKLPLTLYVRARGGGPLPVTVRSVCAELYLEGVPAGSVGRSAPFTLSPGEERVLEMEATLDLAGLLSHAARLLEAISRGEVEVRVSGAAEVSALFLTLTVPLAHTSYVLLGEAKPRVTQASWSADQAREGEVVGYRVVVSNPYRATVVQGSLRVVVVEDVALGFDREVQSREFPISLRPGEARELTGTFQVYRGAGTRGFYLRVYWGGERVYEMPNSYPPRLRVLGGEGALAVLEAYWLVDGTASATARVGSRVTGVVVVGAVGGSVSGYVALEVWEDNVGPDSRVASAAYTISLASGERATLKVEFTPTKASGLLFRGYYLKLFLNGREVWTMGDSYPPRLRVRG